MPATKKTQVFILLAEDQGKFLPGKKKYKVGYATQLDFAKPLPDDRLVEITSENAHQFPTLGDRVWDDNDGPGGCKVLLAYHSPKLEFIGLSTFAIEPIRKDTVFRYGGEVFAEKELDYTMIRDTVPKDMAHIVSPHRRCNWLVLSAYLPPEEDRKYYASLPKELAWANLKSGQLNDGWPGLVAIRTIKSGEVVGWNYDMGRQSGREIFWENALCNDPKANMFHFTPKGAPVTVKFGQQYESSIMICLGGAKDQILFREATQTNQIIPNAQILGRLGRDYIAGPIACAGDFVLTIGGLQEIIDSSLAAGQYALRVTALLTSTIFSSKPKKEIFEHIQSKQPGFSPG